METLWVGLTGGGEEGRKAITDNLRPTMDALVEETSSKNKEARRAVPDPRRAERYPCRIEQ